MALSSTVLRALAQAGATTEMLIAAVEAAEAETSVAVTARRQRFEELNATRLPESEWWPLRAKILERDGFACTYCSAAGVPLCADHVVPLSRGGSNQEDNLVACCLRCNSSKSGRLLSEWGGRK